ncbi:MAG: hypothetical protein DMG96_34585 [Acidobacteria bacterium]|nr:MAG: hypothetical protein DMG96_34585 [Acidobacteriota bacterium]
MAQAADEEALIAAIKLRSGDMGTEQERDRISALEQQLSKAIKNSSAGDLTATSTVVALAPFTCKARVQRDYSPWRCRS